MTVAVSPRAVLEMVAATVPPECHDHIIIIGSLAAGYHFFGRDAVRQVRTKDIDCMLVPRVSAVRTGRTVAERLLAADWSPRTEGRHSDPGTPATPDDDLPAIRLHPPGQTDWFIELLTMHEAGDERDKGWARLELPSGHFGLPSFRYLEPLTQEPISTDLGLRYARPEMLALSNLLRNPTIRLDTMEALVEGRAVKRSNKDLGRVLAIARLSRDDDVATWPQPWRSALGTCFTTRWPDLALRAGSGLRSLLSSDSDLVEAVITSNTGLLSSEPVTPDQLRLTGERLMQDAIEPLEHEARVAQDAGPR
jgi:hypothetical protein